MIGCIDVATLNAICSSDWFNCGGIGSNTQPHKCKLRLDLHYFIPHNLSSGRFAIMSLTVTTSQSTTNPRSSKSDHQWLRLTQRLVLPPTVSSPLLPQTATPTVTTDLSNFPKSPKVLFSNPAPDPSLFEPQSCLYSDGEKMAKRQDIITHPLPGSLWDHSLGELERGKFQLLSRLV